MSQTKHKERTRAQESTNAIERLYISMRHLFSRGFYKPMGISGETLRKSLLALRPEIYGSIAEERTELNGLVYVIERLPEGIEECQFIREQEREVTIAHLGNILGRTYDEVVDTYKSLSSEENPDRFFQLIYWLGKLAINETLHQKKRAVTFSSVLGESIGHHIYGEIWANNIKKVLKENGLLERPIHIISANMHSVLNSIYAPNALPSESKENEGFELFQLLSNEESKPLHKKVKEYASQNGLTYIKDTSGANINVQVIDTSKVNFESINFEKTNSKGKDPVIIVMDYAFGEQAYETMDELLKPYKDNEHSTHLDVESVSIMGKAGILEGGKGDIMIPSAHIFEGTADNYPFKNELRKEDVEGKGVDVFEGSMVTVLGTSLQNKEILKFFHESTWDVIGLEPTYAITQRILEQIF